MYGTPPENAPECSMGVAAEAVILRLRYLPDAATDWVHGRQAGCLQMKRKAFG